MMVSIPQSMGSIIDGKAIAREIRNNLACKVRELDIHPVLAVISAGANDASEVYIRQKSKASQKIGIEFKRHHLEAPCTEELVILVKMLNNDPGVNGILVQLPLPEGIDTSQVMGAITPEKDVDGFHPVNYGKLINGDDGFIACTPAGIMRMFDHEKIELRGKNVVIVNHSPIVGKPLALLMLNRDATVSICHEYTNDLADFTTRADIIITAAGVPALISVDMIKEGAVIIDVSMNRVAGKLCGDVQFEEVLNTVSKITPVPGGVGPMTVAMLMENTVKAALMQHSGKK